MFQGDKERRDWGWVTAEGRSHSQGHQRTDMERFRDLGRAHLAFTVKICEPASMCDTTAAPKTRIKQIGLVLNAILILNSGQDIQRYAQIFLIKCLVGNGEVSLSAHGEF